MADVASIAMSEAHPKANSAEWRRWNDHRWAAMWPRRERLTDAVTPVLLDAAALRPGEAVLDVGCGGGKAALAAGDAVGPGGAVVGADISRPLLDLAERRAAESGAVHVSFVHCDVQVDPIADRLFDVAISQFGVMFFEDPVAAFGSIARHLEPGGRISLACWRSLEENPWHVGPVLAPYLAGPERASAGPERASAGPPEGTPPGPFAFGDPRRVTGLLERAGFVDVSCSPCDLVVEAPADAVGDEDQLVVAGVATEALEDARRAMDRHIRRFGDPGGTLHLPLAFHVVTARTHGVFSPSEA